MSSRDRSPWLLIALVGVGLLAAAFVIWTQQQRLDDAAAVRAQQQRALDLLEQQVEQARYDGWLLRRQVLLLERQIRSLGAVPVTETAAAGTGREPQPTTPGGPRATPRTPTGQGRPPTRSTTTPRPYPSSSPTPTPTTSPTPQPICLGPICLPGG